MRKPKRRASRAVSAILLAVLAAGGLSNVAAAAEDGFRREERQLTVDGLRREYLLLVPARAGNRRLPVVIGLHGGFGSGKTFEQTSQLHLAKGAEDFVFVYPSGYRRSWNAGICCGQAHSQDIDDVEFIRALLSTLSGQANVDAGRVFVTGFSNGAMMTYRLACDLADRLRAVAPVGGGPGKRPQDCKPARTLPLLHLHGTQDTWAPFQGGMSERKEAGMQPSIPAGIVFWARQAGCRSSAPVGDVAGASCTRHASCERDVEVMLCTVEGLGHQWPGGVPSARSLRNFGPGKSEVRASDAILAFFRKYAD